MKQLIEECLRRVCTVKFPNNGEPSHINRPTTGRFNDSLFFTLNGREMIFRMAPPEDQGFLFYERNMMAQEPEIHRIVREETDVPVAEILIYDDSRLIAPRPYLIMDRLPGVPLPEARHASKSAVYRQIGEHLRAVHEITADKYGYLGAHKPMEAAANWPDAFEIMWNKLLDDVVDCGGYSVQQSDRFRRLLDRERGMFERDIESSLLHMDIWAENILVDEEGNVSGIVDWDRALWGDPEIEFAVLDYCGVLVPAFWQGYGAPKEASPRAQRRAIYYYLYEMQKYIVIERRRRGNPAFADRYGSEALLIASQM
ncbi:MAG: aminoglycoside phosphotransferase family protein [Phycisphaerales bacterium]|nr:MAG: aminoglycoside phosphotransferase family protein [Phycisphaerales bacterium]